MISGPHGFVTPAAPIIVNERAIMWGFTRRRAPVTRAVGIPEYDRSLVAALVATRSPGLAFGRTAVPSQQGFGGGHDDDRW